MTGGTVIEQHAQAEIQGGKRTGIVAISEHKPVRNANPGLLNRRRVLMHTCDLLHIAMDALTIVFNRSVRTICEQDLKVSALPLSEIRA